MKRFSQILNFTLAFSLIAPTHGFANQNQSGQTSTEQTSPIVAPAPSVEIIAYSQIVMANQYHSSGTFSTSTQFAESAKQYLLQSTELRSSEKEQVATYLDHYLRLYGSQSNCFETECFNKASLGNETLTSAANLLVNLCNRAGIDMSLVFSNGNTFSPSNFNIPAPPVVRQIPSQNQGQQQPPRQTPYPGQNQNGGINILPIRGNPNNGQQPPQQGNAGPIVQYPKFEGTYPFLDATMTQILSALGVLKTDYTKLNNDLRRRRNYPSKDEVADTIVSDYSNAATAFTIAANSPLLITGPAGYPIAVAAFTGDVYFSLRMFLTMVLQLNDLYLGGMGPDKKAEHAAIALGVAVGSSYAIHAHKFKSAGSAAGVGIKTAWNGMVGTVKSLKLFNQAPINPILEVPNVVKGSETVAKEAVADPRLAKAAGEGIHKVVHGKISAFLVSLLSKYNKYVGAKIGFKFGAMAGPIAGTAAIGASAALTKAWLWTEGQAASGIYKALANEEIKSLQAALKEALSFEDAGFPFVRLLALSTQVSSQRGGDGDVKDIDDLATTFLENLGIKSYATDQSRQRLFAEYTKYRQLQYSEKMEIDPYGELSKLHINMRSELGKMFLIQQLLADNGQTADEKEFFDKQVMKALGLDFPDIKRDFEEYYRSFKNFALRANLGIQKSPTYLLGFDVQWLINRPGENVKPVIYTEYLEPQAACIDGYDSWIENEGDWCN